MQKLKINWNTIMFGLKRIWIEKNQVYASMFMIWRRVGAKRLF